MLPHRDHAQLWPPPDVDAYPDQHYQHNRGESVLRQQLRKRSANCRSDGRGDDQRCHGPPVERDAQRVRQRARGGTTERGDLVRAQDHCRWRIAGQPDQQCRQLDKTAAADDRIDPSRNEGGDDQSCQRQGGEVQYTPKPSGAMHCGKDLGQRVFDRDLDLLAAPSITYLDHAVREAPTNHNDRWHAQDF